MSNAVERLARAALFTSAAWVTILQNNRVCAIWDFSYIMEHATWIAQGARPYRDFALPHAPLSFLIQALIMRLGGHHFGLHVLYAAVLNGAATVLTALVLRKLLPPLSAIVLAAPLCVLGVYSIFPTPFYDPDACFWILLSLWLILRAFERPSRSLAFWAGASTVVPIFVKQNLGLSYFVLVHLGLVLAHARVLGGDAPVRRILAMLLGGAATALVTAALCVHGWVGIGPYVHWTYQYASARRMPLLGAQLEIYRDATLWLWLVAAGGGLIILQVKRRAALIVGSAFFVVPFSWCAAVMLDSGRGIWRTSGTLHALWPLVLLLGMACAPIAFYRRVRGGSVAWAAVLLPVVVVGVAHAAFLSQGVWGSTYGIWPLFMLQLGAVIHVALGPASDRAKAALAAGVVLCLAISGATYIKRNERLSFAKVTQGERVRIDRGPLSGMSTPGPFLPELLELLAFAETHIEDDAALMLLPGEDPFYFASQRRPRFPVLLFDSTVNPHSPEELAELARQKQVRWLVVKRNLQIAFDPMPEMATVLALLKGDFALFRSLPGHDVYVRR